MNWSKGVLVGIVGALVAAVGLFLAGYVVGKGRRSPKPSPDLSVRHTTPVTVKPDTAWLTRYVVKNVPEIPDSVLQRIDLMQPLLLFYRLKSDSLAQEVAQLKAPRTFTVKDSTEIGFYYHQATIFQPGDTAGWLHCSPIAGRSPSLLGSLTSLSSPARIVGWAGWVQRFGLRTELGTSTGLASALEVKIHRKWDLGIGYGYKDREGRFEATWRPFGR